MDLWAFVLRTVGHIAADSRNDLQMPPIGRLHEVAQIRDAAEESTLAQSATSLGGVSWVASLPTWASAVAMSLGFTGFTALATTATAECSAAAAVADKHFGTVRRTSLTILPSELICTALAPATARSLLLGKNSYRP